jgi:hypothetical protein
MAPSEELAKLERQVLAAARVWYSTSANSEAPLAAAMQELLHFERAYAPAEPAALPQKTASACTASFGTNCVCCECNGHEVSDGSCQICRKSEAECRQDES